VFLVEYFALHCIFAYKANSSILTIQLIFSTYLIKYIFVQMMFMKA